MKTDILKALRLTILMLVLFSGIYTLIVYCMAQLVPGKGMGDRVTVNGRSYFTNIGQSFTQDGYFWSRPSAVQYNAAGSGGSNKGPSNKEYLQTVSDRIDSFTQHNPGIDKKAIPVELVTASGSGLDPDISPAAALVQVKRIASIRNIPERQVEALVNVNTKKPLLGLLGPPRVNVLLLNIALDKIKKINNNQIIPQK